MNVATLLPLHPSLLKVPAVRFPLNLSKGLVVWPSTNLKKARKQVYTKPHWDPRRSREPARSPEPRKKTKGLGLHAGRRGASERPIQKEAPPA